MIVDCGVYAKGERQDLPRSPESVATAIDCTPDCFGWIGLHEPTQDELTRVQDLFGLHALAVEDALRPHERPKMEKYDESLLVVLRTLWYVDEHDAVETGQITVFVGDRYVVTVRHGEGVELATARADLEERAQVLGHGPAAVLWAICDAVVDGYDEVANSVMEDVDQVEASVFSPKRTSDAARIYNLKREVLEMRRAILPLREPLDRFAHALVPQVNKDAAPFFRDVSDHLDRVGEQTEGLDSLLSSVLNAHLARVSVQQNDDMRRISAWIAIAATPTTIAGIYGMNFDHIPELGWSNGFYIVLAVMLAACSGLYYLFRRAGWL